MTDEVDFIVPVYNEGSNIANALGEIYATVTLPKRVLIVYDFDEDDTVPVVRELAPDYPGLELVRNTIGRGVINAIRAGIEAARLQSSSPRTITSRFFQPDATSTASGRP